MMMKHLMLGLGFFGGVAATHAAEPELVRLKQHVTTLASPEFAGRRGDGAAKARDYLVAEFRRLGLAPLFGDSYRQEITAGEPAQAIGANVGAKLAATDPKLVDEWIILGVHFDHLGRRGEVIYPGADDNASSVAMMLEVARCFVESPSPRHRGVMFVGFDLEENGLVGSRFFVKAPPVPLDRVRLFVTADMIGRSLGGICPTDVFVLGSEREPGVRPWIARAAEGQPVRLSLFGTDVLMIDRSDYGPFRARQVPYLFFTTAESEVYHSPRDVAETIDYPKLTAISRIVERTLRSAAEAEALPPWAAEPDYPASEAAAFRTVFRILLDHREQLQIKPLQLNLINRAIETADGVVARGIMTPGERNSLVRTAQVILSTAL